MIVPGGGGAAGGGSAVTEAPRPKSPPGYPDLCGRHRLQVEVQVLNREIGFLEEELHSLDGLQPASRCCKEVHEYVASNSDPMIPTNRKKHKSCCLWRWIRKRLCFNFAWVCCSSRCSCKFRRPSCSCNPLRRCCCDCHLRCCQCRCSHCCCWGFPKLSCCRPCCCCGPCTCRRPSCPKCSCGCVFSCPSCADSCLCPKCTRPCCVSRCLCP